MATERSQSCYCTGEPWCRLVRRLTARSANYKWESNQTGTPLATNPKMLQKSTTNSAVILKVCSGNRTLKSLNVDIFRHFNIQPVVRFCRIKIENEPSTLELEQNRT